MIRHAIYLRSMMLQAATASREPAEMISLLSMMPGRRGRRRRSAMLAVDMPDLCPEGLGSRRHGACR